MVSTSSKRASLGTINTKTINLNSVHTDSCYDNYQPYEEKDYNQPYVDEMEEDTADYERNDPPVDSSMNNASITAELETLKSSIDKRIKELAPKVKELDDSYNTYRLAMQYSIGSQSSEYLHEAIRLHEELEPLKAELYTLEAYQQQLAHTIELAPYTDMRNTASYHDFADNYNCEYQGLDYERLHFFSYDIYTYLGDLSRYYTPDEMVAMKANEIDQFALLEYALNNKPTDVSTETVIFSTPALSKVYNYYIFMTEDEIMTYHYLFATEGMESADAYLALLEDDLNKAKGAADAIKFINSLDLTDEGKLEDTLKNFFGVSGKGLADGIATFFDGIANVFENNATLSAEDYEKLIILQYLQENSVYHDEIYEFSSSLGNMVPAMVASAIATLIATPAGGATVAGVSLSAAEVGSIVGSTLMGLSAMGNAKHQALVGGSDVLTATIYGLFIGISETVLGYFLGDMPLISKTAGLTLGKILQEGVEEFIQEWVEAGLRAVILGEDVDWETVPLDATKSFVMGVLMAGFLNGGQKVVGVVINGMTVNVYAEEILTYVEENPGSTIDDAIENVQPELAELIGISTDERVTIEQTLSQQQSDDGLVEVPASYLENKEISLNKNEKIIYDQNTSQFLRVGADGSTISVIPNSVMNSFDNSNRVINTSNGYLDLITGRTYSVAEFNASSSRYNHVTHGEGGKKSQGGHCYQYMLDHPETFIIDPDSIYVDPETGIIKGKWKYQNSDGTISREKTDHCWFPQSWDEAKIVAATNDIISNSEPIAIHLNQNGKALYYGVYDGVPMLVIISNGQIDSSYPLLPGQLDSYLNQRQWVDIR